MIYIHPSLIQVDTPPLISLFANISKYHLFMLGGIASLCWECSIYNFYYVWLGLQLSFLYIIPPGTLPKRTALAPPSPPPTGYLPSLPGIHCITNIDRTGTGGSGAKYGGLAAILQSQGQVERLCDCLHSAYTGFGSQDLTSLAPHQHSLDSQSSFPQENQCYSPSLPYSLRLPTSLPHAGPSMHCLQGQVSVTQIHICACETREWVGLGSWEEERRG